MGLFEKVKNFFYDEEYEEDTKEEIKPVHSKEKRIKEIKVEKEEKEDVSERELFKAERTFNFPMDVDDEEFKTEKIKKQETIEISKPKQPEYKDLNTYTGIRNYAKKEEKKEEAKEPPKFKPTPIISPIYGILDKNYKKEDIAIDSTREYETQKKVDYDTVRKRAYSKAYEEDKDSKGIFYNLDSIMEKEPEKVEEDEVKIVYNDVTLEEEKEDENITIGEKIEKFEREQEEDDSQILSETKEQDLFNLIDNMYNSDDEEEE